uniref:Uncharacterized protein n=1 Tax=Curvibacter symbiont subsp. Hydra magnipapillata TaxID=667019 RepID=C9YBY0_CURXX|nr:hypothetical protein Csp_C22090 [Curvibacter putative symbiont of Hydra magnipapillata]
MLTDIDAAVVDNHHGTLAFFQIKWHDVFSRSLQERASRRSNMLKATEWIDKVNGWIGGRTAREVASVLGMKFSAPVSSEPPILFVMTRHAARFSGEMNVDQRSAWISWPEFTRCVRENSSNDDMLRAICLSHTPENKPSDQPASTKPAKTISYRFNDVEIEVTTPGRE